MKLSLVSASTFVFLVCSLGGNQLARAAEPTSLQSGPPPLTPGFGLSLTAVIGTSNFQGLSNVTDDNDQIDSITGPAESTNELLLSPVWRATYALQNRQTLFFAGVPERELVFGEFFTEVGVRHRLESGPSVGFAYFPDVSGLSGSSEAYVDPLLTGSERQHTDTSGEAFVLQANGLLGGLLSLRAGIGDYAVDEDDNGAFLVASQITEAQQAQLQRDSDFTFLDASLSFPLGESLFGEFSVRNARIDARGHANNFDRMGVGASIFWGQPRFFIGANALLDKDSYVNDNPVFESRRNDTSASMGLTAGFLQLFGQKNLTLILFASRKDNRSNIDFHDNQVTRFGTAITYQFGAYND